MSGSTPTTVPAVVRVGENEQGCIGGCNLGKVCRDITYEMGYCEEPHVRAKLVAGLPVEKGDWSKTWWKTSRKSSKLGDFQPKKSKGPAPVKEQAPKRAVKIKVKV